MQHENALWNTTRTGRKAGNEERRARTPILLICEATQSELKGRQKEHCATNSMTPRLMRSRGSRST